MPGSDLPQDEPAKGRRLEPAKGPVGTWLSREPRQEQLCLPLPTCKWAGVLADPGAGAAENARLRGRGGQQVCAELRKVPPRCCCGGGRALVTPAQPCQQQPEEEKPQTQELFWGRKRR